MKIRADKLKLNDIINLFDNLYTVVSTNNKIIVYNEFNGVSIKLPCNYIVEKINGIKYICLLCKNPIESSITNAVVFTGNAKYGSKFDGYEFMTCICDECIEKNNNIIIFN